VRVECGTCGKVYDDVEPGSTICPHLTERERMDRALYDWYCRGCDLLFKVLTSTPLKPPFACPLCNETDRVEPAGER